MSRKILLVDDELLTIQAIQMNIDWGKCDIDEVFLCDNANDAKTILDAHPVSVIITDIEMPGTDGVAFSGWVREHFPKMSIVFLTGYAEFEYARAAVSLGVEEYILKPVNYRQLQEKIISIVDKLKKSEKEDELKQKYNVHKDELFGEFVRYILGSESNDTQMNLESLLERFNLNFTPDAGYMLLRIKLRKEDGVSWEKLQKVKSAFMALWDDKQTEVYASNFTNYSMTMCIKYLAFKTFDMMEAREKVSETVVQIPYPVSCFMSELLREEQIIPMLRKIEEREEKNVLYQNKVVIVGTRNVGEVSKKITVPYDKWTKLLESHEFEKLKIDVDFSLHSLVIAGQMDAEMLREVYNHFLQRMYHYIGENFGEREKIIKDEKLSKLQKKAVNSVEDFRNFVHYFIELIVNSMEQNKDNVLIVEAKKYIEDHFTEKISRTEVAAYVALNENYLSRLFHTETGLSISDYILQKRMTLAKKLLVQTPKSISDIGMEIGYDATAYFIRVFKREVGKTPKEYRKDMKL